MVWDRQMLNRELTRQVLNVVHDQRANGGLGDMVDVRIRSGKTLAEIPRMTDKRRCPIPLSPNGSRSMRFKQSVVVFLDGTCALEL